MITGFGICFLSVLPIDEIVRYARVADNAGIDSFWIGEGYHFFRRLHGEARSATTTLAAIAISTKRIRIGCAIIPPYTRHPSLIAMEAVALDELSHGRFVLGLGAAKAGIVYLGYDEANMRPITAHKETIEIVRELLAGNTVNYRGKMFTAEAPSLDPGEKARKVPIYIGATGPKMLRLGGAIADGVILPTFTTTNFVKYACKEIRESAERSGRDFSKIPIGATLPFSTAEDGDKARDAIRGLAAVYITNKLQNIKNDMILKAAGLTYDEAKPVRDALLSKGLEAAKEHVANEMLDKVVVSGTPEECIRKFKELADAGLTLPILYQVLGPDKEEAIKLVSTQITEECVNRP